MASLATAEDYQLLIGDVAADDDERLTFLLSVGSSVVVSVAPGLLPWWLDETQEPVPEPAVLVTCQVTSRLMADPDGGDGAVSMERIGWVQTAYDTNWATQSGLLPGGWRLMLKPWRAPELASVRLSVVLPHPVGWGWNEPLVAEVE